MFLRSSLEVICYSAVEHMRSASDYVDVVELFFPGHRGALSVQGRNRRSLHFATPDFLLSLVASVDFMRLSLRKGARAAVSSAAWQEIRVRSGRDDKSYSGTECECPRKIAIPIINSQALGKTKGGDASIWIQYSLREPQVPPPATGCTWKYALSFVIPTAA